MQPVRWVEVPSVFWGTRVALPTRKTPRCFFPIPTSTTNKTTVTVDQRCVTTLADTLTGKLKASGIHIRQSRKRIVTNPFEETLGVGGVRKKNKNYSTRYSRVVSHRSTDRAIARLTSEIGRDPVLSSMYGRSCKYKLAGTHPLIAPYNIPTKRTTYITRVPASKQ